MNKYLLVCDKYCITMAGKYYLALFNHETWNEFLENGSSVYGTTFRKQRSMEKTDIGDFLICYVTVLSHFVGVLEITSNAYFNKERVWKGATYPARVDVRPVYIVKAENGIHVLELKEELVMFNNIKNPNDWRCFFRSSLTSFREHDAERIIEKLKEVSD